MIGACSRSPPACSPSPPGGGAGMAAADHPFIIPFGPGGGKRHRGRVWRRRAGDARPDLVGESAGRAARSQNEAISRAGTRRFYTLAS